jgi:hypothetical protein
MILVVNTSSSSGGGSVAMVYFANNPPLGETGTRRRAQSHPIVNEQGPVSFVDTQDSFSTSSTKFAGDAEKVAHVLHVFTIHVPTTDDSDAGGRAQA